MEVLLPSRANPSNVQRDSDSWTRHRLRAVQLKHWRPGMTVYRRLRSLGANHGLAAQISGVLGNGGNIVKLV